MRTLFELVYCVLVIYGTLLLPVRGAIYSTTDNAGRFSQCLIQKMRVSPHFDEEDRKDMVGVADVMANAMRYLGSGPRGTFSLKILAIAFVTSMADVIILENPTRNVPRKDTYALAVEECSISATGYVDAEFVNEAFRILTALEKEKIPVYNDPSAFEVGEAFSSGKLLVTHSHPQAPVETLNPSAVRPSPVQNPYVPRNYDSNEKTIFEPSGSSFGLSSSSEILHTNMKSPYPIQSAGSTRLLANPSSLRILQTEDMNFESAPPSSILSQEENSQHPTRNFQPFRGLKTPLIKDTTFLVVPPSVILQPDTNVPFQDYSEPNADAFAVQPSSAKNIPSTQEGFKDFIPPGVNVPFQNYPEPETKEIGVQSFSARNPPTSHGSFGDGDIPSSAVISQSNRDKPYPDYSETEADKIPIHPSKVMDLHPSQEGFVDLPLSSIPFQDYSEPKDKEISVQPSSARNLPLSQEGFSNLPPSATISQSDTNEPIQDHSVPGREEVTIQPSNIKNLPPSQEGSGSLPPSPAIQQSGINVPYQDYSEPQAKEIPIQPSSARNVPLSQEGFGIVRPAANPQSGTNVPLQDHSVSGEEAIIQDSITRNLPPSQDKFGILPPSPANPQSGTNVPSQDNSETETKEIPIQPSSVINLPISQEGFGNLPSSLAIPQPGLNVPSQNYSKPETKEIPVQPSSAGNLPISQEGFGNLSPLASNPHSGTNLPFQDQSVQRKEEIPIPPSSIRNSPSSQEEFGNLAPPLAIPQSGINVPFQNFSAPRTEEITIQDSSAIIPPKNSEGSGDLIPPKQNSQTSSQISNIPINYSLQSIIADILLNSSYFKNAFSLVTDKQNAIALARNITEQSLFEYNSEIINEALVAVSNAVAAVTLSSPENYALALSNALASVLELHDMPLFVGGASIASTMVTSLDNTKPVYDQQTNSKEDIIDGSSNNGNIQSSWEQKELPLNFESPILAPEDVNSEIFSNALSQHLVGSFKLANLFCGTDLVTDRMQVYFSLIKSSLPMFGRQISSIAATMISEALMEITEEALCSRYAHVISDTLAEVLYENGFLEQANPEDILIRMELSASHIEFTPRKSKDTQTTSSEIESLGDPLPSTVMDAQSETDSGDLPAVQQQFETHMPEFSTHSFIGSSDYIPISSVNGPSPNYEGSNYYTIPSTTPLPTEIKDQEYTEAVILVEILTSIAKVPTEKPVHSSSDDDNINKEKLASDTLIELDSSRKSLKDKSTDLNKPTMAPSEIPFNTTTVGDNPGNEDGVISQPVEKTHSRNSHQGKRRRKKKKPAPPQSDSETILEDTDGEDDETMLPDLPPGSHPHSEPPSVDQNKDVPFEISSSEDSLGIINVPPVELQPSFQGPESSDTFAASEMLPSKSRDLDYEDTSLLTAKAVSQIASSSIAFIRSENFNTEELCGMLNEYAAVVNIPPVTNCVEIAVIDYLLNVLRSTTEILKGV